ncbi:MAG: hypothetical protein IPO21_03890 [Bacteroidales bacterium]|nr:hypothetical protein [Bacteroidales bacterium]
MKRILISRLSMISLVFFLISCGVTSGSASKTQNDTVVQKADTSAISNSDSTTSVKNRYSIIIKDSIPLRIEPKLNSQILKYAYIGLLVKILDISADSLWYKIEVVDQNLFPFSIDENFWIFHDDIFFETGRLHANITVDLSLLGKGKIQDAKRIMSDEYIYTKKSLNLDSAFYVSPIYSNYDDVSGTGVFSSEASICIKRACFQEEGDEKQSDAESFSEYKERYTQLYGKDSLKAFYKIKSKLLIDSVKEVLICSKLVMDEASCYPEKFIGVEINHLQNQKHIVHDYSFLSSYVLKSDTFSTTKLFGEVQNIYLIYILKVYYQGNQSDTIVRRIFLWWPLCM